MNDSIQIAFRIDRASREMARAFNINISEVCRKAIQQEIGIKLENNPNLLISTKTALDKYVELLERQKEQQSKFMDNLTLVCDNLRHEREEKEKSEKEKEELKKQLSDRITTILYRSYLKSGGIEYLVIHLPEYMGHGDYMFKSQAEQLTNLFHKPVDIETIHYALRKYRDEHPEIDFSSKETWDKIEQKHQEYLENDEDD